MATIIKKGENWRFECERPGEMAFFEKVVEAGNAPELISREYGWEIKGPLNQFQKHWITIRCGLQP